MKLLLPLIATSWLALTDHPCGAAFTWCSWVALLHAIEESKGKLWIYFGLLADAPWLQNINGILGFLIIVLPALSLQWVAAWCAFMDSSLTPSWLALLIGGGIGDALFSHAIPFAADQKPNPGLPTAAIYAVDGLLMAILWQAELMASPRESLVGLVIGLGFFASVVPGLRLTRLLPI